MDEDKIELVLIVLMLVIFVAILFAFNSNENLYQECIDSGKHDKFECYEMIKGE